MPYDPIGAGAHRILSGRRECSTVPGLAVPRWEVVAGQDVADIVAGLPDRVSLP